MKDAAFRLRPCDQATAPRMKQCRLSSYAKLHRLWGSACKKRRPAEQDQPCIANPILRA
jgi:hypothetical protein